MEDAFGKKVRFYLGLVIPALATAVLAIGVIVQATRYEGLGFLGSALGMWALLAGPFLIYYFALRTPEFSIAIGLLLIAAATYAGINTFRAMDTGSSTAGVALLWLPLIGYPVVAVGALLDRMSR